MSEFKIVKNGDVTVVALAGELALMNPNNGDYFVLNEVGRDIWELIDGKRSEKDIITNMIDMYDISIEACSASIKDYLKRLEDESLIIRS